MADEIITREQLIDASKDAESLQKFISGSDIEDVLTRLGKIYPTLAKLVRMLMETGGWKAYETEAILLATTPLVNPSVGYAFDTKKLYLWNGTNWIDEGLSPLDQAKQQCILRPSLLLGTNINTFFDAGFYIQNNNQAFDLLALGYPVNHLGVLEVFKSSASAYTVQRYQSSSNRLQYHRVHNGVDWTSWMASNDFATFANASPMFKRALIAAGTDLNTVTTDGYYYQTPSSNATLALNYPIALAGFLTVEYISVNQITQTYTVASTNAKFFRIKQGANWSAWKNIGGFYDGRQLEWQAVTETVKPVFNKETKTLSWTGFLLAPYDDGGTTKRIRINSISVTFSANFEVLYIDLDALPTSKDITQADVGTILKVGTYQTGFLHNQRQIPLAKYDANENRLTPCAGFLPIYNSGSNADVEDGGAFIEYEKSASLLSVYFPASNGKKIKVGLTHQVVPFDGVSPNSQSDLWRIFKAFQCNEETYAEEVQIVDGGEWEFATQIVGSTDHVGGYHGDELQTASTFYVDQSQKDQDFTSVLKRAKEIQFIQQSVIYFQNTTTPLANHVKDITFKSDGSIVVKQRIEWVADANLATAWITLFPILRTGVTDRSSRSNDYFIQVDDNTESGFPRRFTNIYAGAKVRVWGTSSKYSSEVKFVKTPDWNPNQNAYVYNAGGYNKVYGSAFNGAITSGIPVAAGTIWEWEIEYKLNILS